MKIILFVILVVIFLLAAGLWFWRLPDHTADRFAKKRLIATQPADPARFDPAMVSNLPEPARRYFLFTIQPGTPLYTVAEISMTGKFSLGTRDAPDYMDMTAEQVLALPAGFVWKMSAKNGLMHISGSDSENWTRFWFMGLIPVDSGDSIFIY